MNRIQFNMYNIFVPNKSQIASIANYIINSDIITLPSKLCNNIGLLTELLNKNYPNVFSMNFEDEAFHAQDPKIVAEYINNLNLIVTDDIYKKCPKAVQEIAMSGNLKPIAGIIENNEEVYELIPKDIIIRNINVLNKIPEFIKTDKKLLEEMLKENISYIEILSIMYLDEDMLQSIDAETIIDYTFLGNPNNIQLKNTIPSSVIDTIFDNETIFYKFLNNGSEDAIHELNNIVKQNPRFIDKYNDMLAKGIITGKITKAIPWDTNGIIKQETIDRIIDSIINGEAIINETNNEIISYIISSTNISEEDKIELFKYLLEKDYPLLFKLNFSEEAYKSVEIEKLREYYQKHPQALPEYLPLGLKASILNVDLNAKVMDIKSILHESLRTTRPADYKEYANFGQTLCYKIIAAESVEKVIEENRENITKMEEVLGVSDDYLIELFKNYKNNVKEYSSEMMQLISKFLAKYIEDSAKSNLTHILNKLIISYGQPNLDELKLKKARMLCFNNLINSKYRDDTEEDDKEFEELMDELKKTGLSDNDVKHIITGERNLNPIAIQKKNEFDKQKKAHNRLINILNTDKSIKDFFDSLSDESYNLIIKYINGDNSINLDRLKKLKEIKEKKEKEKILKSINDIKIFCQEANIIFEYRNGTIVIKPNVEMANILENENINIIIAYINDDFILSGGLNVADLNILKEIHGVNDEEIKRIIKIKIACQRTNVRIKYENGKIVTEPRIKIPNDLINLLQQLDRSNCDLVIRYINGDNSISLDNFSEAQIQSIDNVKRICQERNTRLKLENKILVIEPIIPTKEDEKEIENYNSQIKLLNNLRKHINKVTQELIKNGKLKLDNIIISENEIINAINSGKIKSDDISLDLSKINSNGRETNEDKDIKRVIKYITIYSSLTGSKKEKIKKLLFDEGLIYIVLFRGEGRAEIGEYDPIKRLDVIFDNLDYFDSNYELEQITLENIENIINEISLKKYVTELDITLIGVETLKKIIYNEKFLEQPAGFFGMSTKKMPAEKRAEFASRYMSLATKKDKKTIPNIEVSAGGYTISRYSNFDPAILVSGIDTEACFRIGGNDNDFLLYTIFNKNGFVLKITDITGKIVGRISGFRSGNSVYFNQLRSVQDKGENVGAPPEVAESLRRCAEEYARRLIEETKDTEEPIENVFITKSYSYSYSSLPRVSGIDTYPMRLDDEFGYDANIEEFVKLVKDNGLELRSDGYFVTDYPNYETLLLASSHDYDTSKEIEPVLKKYNPKITYELKSSATKSEKIGEFTEETLHRINVIRAKSIYWGNEEKRQEGRKSFVPITSLDNYMIIVTNDFFYITVDKAGNVDGMCLQFDKDNIEEYNKCLTEVKNMLQEREKEAGGRKM